MTAALLLALLTVGCGPRDSRDRQRRAAPTTIAFASNVNEDEIPALRRLLDQFEARTKSKIDLGVASRFRDESGIKVKLLPSSSGARLARLRSDDPGFHLFAEDIVSLRPLVEENLVQAPGVGIPSEVDSKMIAALRFSGDVLFLPFRPNVRLVYANKTALRDAGVTGVPHTHAEFIAVAEKLKASAGHRPMTTLSLSDEEGGDATAVTISELILGQGGDPRILNNDASLRAFEFLRQSWQNRLLARQSLSAKHDTEVQYLKGGTTWLAQNWSFTSSELWKAKQLANFEVYAGWQGPRAHVVGGDALGIPRQVRGDEKVAALLLAKFLMSPEAQHFLSRENSWPSILSDGYVGRPEQAATFRAIEEALAEGWYRPTESYWKDSTKAIDVTRAMNEAVARAVIGSEPVRQVLDDLDKRMREAHQGQYPPKA